MVIDPSDRTDLSPEAAAGCPSILQRFVNGLAPHWRRSFADWLWRDRTPFGRATIFFPTWIGCWLVLPFLVPILLVIFLADKYVVQKLPDVPSIFFNR